MKTCAVSVVGKDGKTHTELIKAASLFDAVEQAARGWMLLWWWPGVEAVAEVRAEDECWRVSFERVRQWRAGQGRRSGNA